LEERDAQQLVSSFAFLAVGGKLIIKDRILPLHPDSLAVEVVEPEPQEVVNQVEKAQGEDQEKEADNMLKELALRMARAIVNHPDQVHVEEVEGAAMIVLELSVNPDDMGRVIGKRGRVANAMRTLLRASAAKEGKRVNLEIIET
jgi:predicted RNA-binding protein YlqC (UPF0109 family)